MKHIALLLFLSALGALNLIWAFSPELSRQYFRWPRSASARKVIHLVSAVVFLLGVLFIVYAMLDPRAPS